MKRINASDLVIVLNDLDYDYVLSINDVISLFEAFGDDWHFDGEGKWVKTSENEAMKALWEKYNR